MANRIKIKKGLQIPLLGKPENVDRGSLVSEFVHVWPEDFQGITPRLSVKVDDTVKAGQALFHSKMYPDMLFTSPVSGTVVAINRGAKRRILDIVVRQTNRFSMLSLAKKMLLNYQQMISKNLY